MKPENGMMPGNIIKLFERIIDKESQIPEKVEKVLKRGEERKKVERSVNIPKKKKLRKQQMKISQKIISKKQKMTKKKKKKKNNIDEKEECLMNQ